MYKKLRNYLLVSLILIFTVPALFEELYGKSLDDSVLLHYLEMFGGLLFFALIYVQIKVMNGAIDQESKDLITKNNNPTTKITHADALASNKENDIQNELTRLEKFRNISAILLVIILIGGGWAIDVIASNFSVESIFFAPLLISLLVIFAIIFTLSVYSNSRRINNIKKSQKQFSE